MSVNPGFGGQRSMGVLTRIISRRSLQPGLKSLLPDLQSLARATRKKQ
jgi:hypothetical protein